MDRAVGLERDSRALLAAVDDVEDAERELDVRMRDGLGVNMVDFSVLRWVDRVHRRGGTTRVGDIADQFGVSSGSATEIVHRLTRAGLLERTVHPGDARVRRLVPTAEAEQRLFELVGTVRADLDALLVTVTEQEEARLLQLLGCVSDILRGQHEPAQRGSGVRPR